VILLDVSLLLNVSFALDTCLSLAAAAEDEEAVDATGLDELALFWSDIFIFFFSLLFSLFFFYKLISVNEMYEFLKNVYSVTMVTFFFPLQK